MCRRLIAAAVLTTSMAAPLVAQSDPPPGRDLARITLEELMTIRVTSAARKSQRAEDVPAAVYVITRTDIRQSGLSTVPELLRLAPGVQVAQVNASKWAVSIRGFNGLYSNKLLVLVDGRSVYTRTYSGVFWELLDLMVSDIDRIEVIRGPGGAVWGANAVNGVINIITRPASETPGLTLRTSAGTFERARAGVRYGGTFGAGAYRLFSQWSGYADANAAAQTVLADRWRSLTNGFRVDWPHGADSTMVQGHLTANRTRPGWYELRRFEPGIAPSTDGVSEGREASVLGRWTRTRTDGTVIQVQAYHTATRRDESILGLSERLSDVDGQYETRVGSRHGLMLGAGYRQIHIAATPTLTMQLGSHRARTFNAFVQDEIAIRGDVSLTVGSKIEHDTLGAWGLQPSVRLIWEATSSQHVWAAVSSARRTPSFADRFIGINFGVLPGPGLPIVTGFKGNPAYRSEDLVQTEAGYRIRRGSTAALDVTAFSGSYSGLEVLQRIEPRVELTPAPAHVFAGVTFANLLHVRTSGVEVSGHWAPISSWTLAGSYAFLHLAGGTVDTTAGVVDADTDGNAPRHQWQIRSTVSLRPGLQGSVSVARVGRLRLLEVPAYTRLDGRVELELTDHLSAVAAGQNLLNARHREFTSDILALSSEMPRSVRIDLRWRF